VFAQIPNAQVGMSASPAALEAARRWRGSWERQVLAALTPMPRRHLPGLDGLVFHVMNRAIEGVTLFEHGSAYDAFTQVLADAGRRYATRLLAYCVMPNHWHLVVQPDVDRVLSDYMRWLTTTHAQRWRRASCSRGRGAVYQGRFRWVPVEPDLHFLRLCLYVERNPVRAKLIARAERWRWSSAWQRGRNHGEGPTLAEWPVTRPARWNDLLNERSSPAATDSIRQCVSRGRPFGSAEWCSRTSALYRISEQPPGRPPGPLY
jgi:putative transposase